MDLNYKGDYGSSKVYAAGDVVKFTDNIWYVRKPFNANKSNIPCTDTLRWEQANELVAMAAEMAMEAVSSYASARSTEQVFSKVLSVSMSTSSTSGTTIIAAGGTLEKSISANADAVIDVRMHSASGVSDKDAITVSSFSLGSNGSISVTFGNTDESNAITKTASPGTPVQFMVDAVYCGK